MRVALLKMEAKSRGGLEKYSKRIASAFAAKGAEVFLLTTQTAGKAQTNPGVETIALPGCRWPGFLKLEQFDRSIQKWLQNHPADLVFGMDRARFQTHIRAGNGVHAAFLKHRIAAEGRLKYATCLINPLHRKILEIEKTAFEFPGLKKLFVNSQMVQKEVLHFYRTDPKKIEVVYNGVEWKEHEPSFQFWPQKKAEELARLQLDSEALQLLFVGNGYLRKGLHQLLKALALWKFKDWQLLVVGKEKRSRFYKTIAEKLGLAGRVRFCGPQNEMIPFYQMADVMVIPSFYDPFANVTLEALSFGLFVISSKTNGGHEILTDQNGAVIEDLTVPESIVACLEKARAARKTLESSLAIRSSVSQYDFSIQLSKLIDACEI